MLPAPKDNRLNVAKWWLGCLLFLCAFLPLQSALSDPAPDRDSLIEKIRILQQTVNDQQLILQSQSLLITRLKNQTEALGLDPDLDTGSGAANVTPVCNDAVFIASMTALGLSIIAGAVGPIAQFARYFITYGKTGKKVPCTTLGWPVPAFIGSVLFLANVAINPQESQFGRITDTLPSSSLGLANMLVYLSLFVYMIRYHYRGEQLR